MRGCRTFCERPFSRRAARESCIADQHCLDASEDVERVIEDQVGVDGQQVTDTSTGGRLHHAAMPENKVALTVALAAQSPPEVAPVPDIEKARMALMSEAVAEQRVQRRGVLPVAAPGTVFKAAEPMRDEVDHRNGVGVRDSQDESCSGRHVG